jgi:hypothetical protein
MRNINTTLLDKRRTSIFIAHRLRTVVDAGTYTTTYIHSLSVMMITRDQT